MELLTSQLIWGIILFFLGIFMLGYCSSIERENFGTMQKRRTLKLYGRRKRDSEASVLYDYKGSLMTFGGAALSLIGLIQFFSSVTW